MVESTRYCEVCPKDNGMHECLDREMQTWKNWLNPWEVELGHLTLSPNRIESSLNVSYRTLDTIFKLIKHISLGKRKAKSVGLVLISSLSFVWDVLCNLQFPGCLT